MPGLKTSVVKAKSEQGAAFVVTAGGVWARAKLATVEEIIIGVKMGFFIETTYAVRVQHRLNAKLTRPIKRSLPSHLN